MEPINILLLAVALAMDAFAVSIATGVALKSVSPRQTFRLAWHFGLFQAMMPVIGWSAGLTVRSRIEAYDHWIAFALLAFVAQGMLRSAFKGDHGGEDAKDPTRGLTMVMLSVATSIDALAVGLSLSMINVSIWTPALIIGVVAGAFTTAGMHLGKVIGSVAMLSRWAEMTGGIVLLAIGINILREHGVLNFF
ncbi:manganese efflux pump MntP family protein [Desulfosarcina ovata]|uniref:Putative manganese efflux pump MntP n=1 Tax=Desulfosarcina ovata subsp. ovata TaxID=2752305 RepID=A0A5K8ADD0_9BACT|nr:manganese efflux pump MntP family protein [Desulfosarcina ovata]BBO90587.1 putative manganese efflux pump MntP [Desulfosarcina ovata subsp. ovata]